MLESKITCMFVAPHLYHRSIVLDSLYTGFLKRCLEWLIHSHESKSQEMKSQFRTVLTNVNKRKQYEENTENS